MPSFIHNRAQLETSAARRLILDLAEVGLQAIDTGAVIRRVFEKKEIDSAHTGRLFLVAIGKCALDAAVVLEEILGEQISAGMAIDIRADLSGQLKRVRLFQGDHPFPSEHNVKATQEIIKLLEGMTERDLALFVISGGGSTLLCQPAPTSTSGPYNFTYQQEADIVAALFKAGATIRELNTARKHLSLARGGYLARYAYPARVVSLIFSDVPGDDLNFIASGPTVLDQTTVHDAQLICEKYNLAEKTGFQITNLLETPKEEKYFARVKNYLVVSNRVALEAMPEVARVAGYRAKIQDIQVTGEARVVAGEIVAELHQQQPGTVLLYGGETTVTARGHGQGGRNQELTLAALPLLAENELILSLASDGHDNTDVAGAIADKFTKQKAVDKSLDVKTFLADNDSYHFFKETGDQVKTGQTGANVSDLIIAIKE